MSASSARLTSARCPTRCGAGSSNDRSRPASATSARRSPSSRCSSPSGAASCGIPRPTTPTATASSSPRATPPSPSTPSCTPAAGSATTDLDSYCRDGSLFGAHPEFGLPGVEVGTGSLGQGLSVGCGLALALQRRRSPGRVFALLSDAECNEGQVWEAAMFAAHHRLANLIALVDANGMQALGPTRGHPRSRIARSEVGGVRLAGGDVDGHDAVALAERLDAPTERWPAADADLPDTARQGRVVHGRPARVALPQPDARAVRRAPWEEPS